MGRPPAWPDGPTIADVGPNGHGLDQATKSMVDARKIVPMSIDEEAAEMLAGISQTTFESSCEIQHLPDSLPFQFQLDIPCAELGAKIGRKSQIDHDHLNQIPRTLENGWRHARYGQELAWARKGAIPPQVIAIAEDNCRRNGKGKGKGKGMALQGINRRLDQMRRTSSMMLGKKSDASIDDDDEDGIRAPFAGPSLGSTLSSKSDLQNCVCVRGLETEPGRPLTVEDLNTMVGRMNVTMIVELENDPLLEDIGHTGPTEFKVLMYVYERHMMEDALRPEDPTRELRFAYLPNFDYAMLFPTRPYPTCTMARPEAKFCFDSMFPVGIKSSCQGHFDRMLIAESLLTWLFWECFNTFFPPDSAHSTSPAQKIPLLGDPLEDLRQTSGMTFTSTSGGKSRKKMLKYCQSHDDALGVLWRTTNSISRFELPFCEEVRDCDVSAIRNGGQECDDELVRIVQHALHVAASRLDEWRVRAQPPNSNDKYVPRAWQEVPGNTDEKSITWPLEVQMAENTEGRRRNATFIKKIEPELYMASMQNEEKEPCFGIDADLYMIQYLSVLKQSGREAASDEEVPKEAEEEHEMDESKDKHHKEVRAVVDLAKLDSDSVVRVLSINVEDHWQIQNVLDSVVAKLEQIKLKREEQEKQQKDLSRKMAQLAFGLRTLQRGSIKDLMRNVGLSVLETDSPRYLGTFETADWSSVPMTFCRTISACFGCRSRWGAQTVRRVKEDCEMQRVFLLTAPNGVLQQRAEIMNMELSLAVNQSGTFTGGFLPEQFERNAPRVKFWVEKHSRPYPYHPYFQASMPGRDPVAEISPAERKYLLRRFMSDPLSSICFPDGTIDPRQGGADFDIKEMISEHILDDFTQVECKWILGHIYKKLASPWLRHSRCRMLRSIFNLFNVWPGGYSASEAGVGIPRLLCMFGPQIASYFEFMTFLTKALLPAAILGLLAQISGDPTAHADEGGAWRWVQPCFGLFMALWGNIVCVVWRRWVANLTYSWQNGLIEAGEELQAPQLFTGHTSVRPEFAVRARAAFEQATADEQADTLAALKSVLRVQKSEEDDSPHAHGFTERKLRRDIDRYNEACYESSSARRRRHILSLLCSSVFALLGIGITVASLELHRYMCPEDDCKEDMQRISADGASCCLTGILVPLLSMIHRSVAESTTDWENSRIAREHEASLFWKLFAFDAFNYYSGCLWLAFYRRDMRRLRLQVTSLMVSLSLVSNIMEVGLPLFMRRLGMQYEVKEVSEEGAAQVQRALAQVVDQRIRVYEFDLVSELIEIDLLFGMVTMFSIAFPLAPCLWLISNMFELRIDAFKLLQLQHFPEPRMVVGIGMSYQAQKFIAVISVFVNVGLLLIPKYKPKDGTSLEGTGDELLFPDQSKEERWKIMTILEHALLLTIAVLYTSCNTVSSQVKEEEFRQRYFEKREATEARWQAAEEQVVLKPTLWNNVARYPNDRS